jgi:hypothetical protein
MAQVPSASASWRALGVFAISRPMLEEAVALHDVSAQVVVLAARPRAIFANPRSLSKRGKNAPHPAPNQPHSNPAAGFCPDLKRT